MRKSPLPCRTRIQLQPEPRASARATPRGGRGWHSFVSALLVCLCGCGVVSPPAPTSGSATGPRDFTSLTPDAPSDDPIDADISGSQMPGPEDSPAPNPAPDSITDPPADDPAGSDVGDATGYDPALPPPSPFVPDSPDRLDPFDPVPLDPLTFLATELPSAAALFDVGTDPATLGALVPLLADNIVLGLVVPTGPADSFTFLELLCRDVDLPDTYCRRRYGR